MNLNPQAFKILCYGDSNTWGYIPLTKQRYPVGVRWTSLLQQKLGADFWIIEEGLNSRTTDLDDPTKPGRNGLTYLRPCLESHHPIDLVIMMLGTNDMKERFNRSPADIVQAIERLLKEILAVAANQHQFPSPVILVAPPVIDESVAGVSDKYLGAGQKSQQLGRLYQQLANRYQVQFVNMADYVSPSKKDGYHFESESHQKMAAVIFDKIREMRIF